MALIQREVKLFEAGNYPSHGGEYPESRLDEWVENHAGGRIPFNIAHLDDAQVHSNPLLKLGEDGMGFVANLYRKGRELFGRLFIPGEVNDLIDKTGVKGVSVGLSASRDRILEVSWVANPRVATAQIFSGAIAFAFSGEIISAQADTDNATEVVMPEIKEPEKKEPDKKPEETRFSDEMQTQFAQMKKENADLVGKISNLEGQLFSAKDDAALEKLVADRKITPAQKQTILDKLAKFAPAKFADDAPAERPIDAFLEFFADYDPALVLEATKPKLREVEREDDVAMNKDDEAAFRRFAEQGGLEGEGLDKLVASFAASRDNGGDN